jgi:arylsulfatase A-like enzyme
VKATSPNLDSLCRDSVVFTQAIAHAPSTLSSHASLLTSLIPQHHGASVTRMVALARDHLTLASALASAGFQTASFNGGGQIDALFGLDHGFQVYQSPKPAHDEEAWARDVGDDRFGTVVAAALGWLDENRGRFFLFLHTYEVHHPYSPDPAFGTLLPESYDGPLPDDISIDLLERINARRLEATPKDLEHVVHAYDVEIRSVDAALGGLVADLKRRGLYDRTLLIVTSDHGEEFGEHGKMGWHSHTLHDELLRVPLVVKFPGSWRAGTSLDAQVRGIDVAPTVMSVARVAIPPAFEGVDLVRYAGRGERPPPTPSPRSTAAAPPCVARNGSGTAARSIDSHPTGVRRRTWPAPIPAWRRSCGVSSRSWCRRTRTPPRRPSSQLPICASVSGPSATSTDLALTFLIQALRSLNDLADDIGHASDGPPAAAATPARGTATWARWAIAVWSIGA